MISSKKQASRPRRKRTNKAALRNLSVFDYPDSDRTVGPTVKLEAVPSVVVSKWQNVTRFDIRHDKKFGQVLVVKARFRLFVANVAPAAFNMTLYAIHPFALVSGGSIPAPMVLFGRAFSRHRCKKLIVSTVPTGGTAQKGEVVLSCWADPGQYLNTSVFPNTSMGFTNAASIPNAVLSTLSIPTRADLSSGLDEDWKYVKDPGFAQSGTTVDGIARDRQEQSGVFIVGVNNTDAATVGMDLALEVEWEFTEFANLTESSVTASRGAAAAAAPSTTEHHELTVPAQGSRFVRFSEEECKVDDEELAYVVTSPVPPSLHPALVRSKRPAC